jgi:acyl-coenzyme A synthetase/AMP-(fatty) acid ligase
MHRRGAIPVVCETYAAQVLGITPEDRCLSASKAFFAYGLGASVLFPMSVGAAAVLEPAPARPEIMTERAGKYAATLFFAGPTFFAGMLRAGLPADALAGVRLAASAGEARATTPRGGVPGEWLRTGDTYVKDPDGYYTCLGRTSDMLKPSGIWVSPAEVEARLLAHEAVVQAVVVAAADGLERLVAFVILQPTQSVTEAELIELCRQGLPSVKRPRKVVGIDVGKPNIARVYDALPGGMGRLRRQSRIHRHGHAAHGV